MEVIEGIKGNVEFTTQLYSGVGTDGFSLHTTPIDWIESFVNTLQNEVAPKLNNFSVTVSRGNGQSVGKVAPIPAPMNSDYFNTCNNVADGTQVNWDNDWNNDEGLHPAQPHLASYPYEDNAEQHDPDETWNYDLTNAPRMPSNIYNHTNWTVTKEGNNQRELQYNLGYDFYSFRCDLILTFTFNERVLHFRLKYPLTTTGFQYDGRPVALGGDTKDANSYYYQNRSCFSSTRASCIFYYPFFCPSTANGSTATLLDSSTDYITYSSDYDVTSDMQSFFIKKYKIKKVLTNLFLKPTNYNELVRIQCSKNDAHYQNELTTPYDSNNRIRNGCLDGSNDFNNVYTLMNNYGYKNTRDIAYLSDDYTIWWDATKHEQMMGVNGAIEKNPKIETYTALNSFKSLVGGNVINKINYIQSYDNKTIYLSLKTGNELFFNIIFFELEDGNIGLIYNNQLYIYREVGAYHSLQFAEEEIVETKKIEADSWLLQNFDVSINNTNSHGVSLYRITQIGDNIPNTHIMGKLNGKRTVFYVFKSFLKPEVSEIAFYSGGKYENDAGVYTITPDAEPKLYKPYYTKQDKVEWLAIPIKQIIE